MKEKGDFFWKKRWFSICSIHYSHNDECNICKKGYWINVWKYNISSFIFKINPKFWICWVNKKGRLAEWLMQQFAKL